MLKEQLECSTQLKKEIRSITTELQHNLNICEAFIDNLLLNFFTTLSTAGMNLLNGGGGYGTIESKVVDGDKFVVGIAWQWNNEHFPREPDFYTFPLQLVDNPTVKGCKEWIAEYKAEQKRKEDAEYRKLKEQQLTEKFAEVKRLSQELGLPDPTLVNVPIIP